MLQKLRNMFGSTSRLSRSASLELRDSAKGLILSRYKELREEAKIGLFRGHSTYDEDEISSLKDILEMAEKDVQSELMGTSLHSHRNALQESLNSQSIKLMQAIRKAQEVRHYLSTEPNDPNALREIIGFQLRSQKSSICGAGDGLYIDGWASAGSVIGYFPGKVWLGEHLKAAVTMNELKDDPHFLTMLRYDDVIIDSRCVKTIRHHHHQHFFFAAFRLSPYALRLTPSLTPR